MEDPCAPIRARDIETNRDIPPPPDASLRLEALKLAIGQGGSDAIVREKAEAFLAFLKGEPAPEKAGE